MLRSLSRDDPQQALAELFQQELAPLHGYVFARCGSAHLAEEITGDVFVEAATRWGQGRGHEVTPAWLRTVAQRRLIDRWRSRSRHENREAALGNELLRRHSIADAGDDGRVLSALSSLPERQRAALALRYVDEFSVSEVADALEIPYRAAESLLARSRRSFARAYEEAT